MPPRLIPGSPKGGPLSLEQLQFCEALLVIPQPYAVNTNAFTQIPVVGVTDPNGLIAPDGTYVVPEDGTYSIAARVRIYDLNLWAGWANGDGFGLNVGRSNVDESTLIWQLVNASPRATKRQSLAYQRVSEFSAGDRLRLYVYIDTAAAHYQLGGTDFSIYQLARG